MKIINGKEISDLEYWMRYEPIKKGEYLTCRDSVANEGTIMLENLKALYQNTNLFDSLVYKNNPLLKLIK